MSLIELEFAHFFSKMFQWGFDLKVATVKPVIHHCYCNIRITLDNHRPYA